MAKKDDWGDEIRDYELDPANGEKILESLRKIKYQTSRHLCGNTMLSIGTIVDSLDALIARGDVVSRWVGSANAYFLPENDPPEGCRLILGGDKSVRLTEPAPRKIDPGAPKIGDKVVLPRVIDFPPVGARGRAYIDIDADELEGLAAQGLTQKHIAEELGIGWTTLQAKLRDMSHLRAALERGVKEYQKIKGTTAAATQFQAPRKEEKMKKQTEPGKPAEEKKHGGSRSRIAVDAEAVEKAASENKTDPAIAAALGIALNTLYNKLRNFPELREARERGRQIFKSGKPASESEPAIKTPAEIIAPGVSAEAKNGGGSEEAVTPGVPMSHPSIGISMTIQIPLWSRSREFIDRIRDLVAEFE